MRGTIRLGIIGRLEMEGLRQPSLEISIISVVELGGLRFR